MKNWNEVVTRATLEVEQWFIKACRTPAPHYWFYIEATAEHDGGFLIAETQPANPDYKQLDALGVHLTKEQNLHRFLEVARSLPILDREKPVAASQAKDAQIYDPFGCGLSKAKAKVYWLTAHFVSHNGNIVRAESVNLKSGILSVTFPDGSILCPAHWQI